MNALQHYREQAKSAAQSLRLSPDDRNLQQWLNDNVHAECLALSAMIERGETTCEELMREASEEMHDYADYDPADEGDDPCTCPDCGGDLDGEFGCTDSQCGWTYADDYEDGEE